MKSFFCTLIAVCFVAVGAAAELQDAAARGDLDKVRALVQANPSAISARVDGTTALHEATRGGHGEVVKFLIASGANVNALNFSGLTPLKLALGYQRTGIAEYLRTHGGLEKAAAPAAPASRIVVATNVVQPPTALFNSVPSAATKSAPSAPPILAQTNTALAPVGTNKPPTERELMQVLYPIHEAARVGDVDQIKFLFKTSPDIVDATDEKGLTPLHTAAANRQFNAAETLLSLRAKVNARADSGLTPLHVAVRQGDLGMIGLFLTNRATANARDNFDNTPLLLAVQSVNSENVDQQFVVGKKFGMTNWGGFLVQQLQMVQLLVAHRAEVNVRNRAGATPLSEAARVGNEPVVNVLLRAGADPNGIESATSVTPLHLAAARGHAAIAEALLRHRAAVNAADARGETPLCYALREGHTNAVALLRRAGGTVGQMRALSLSEKSLVDFYERTEMTLRMGNSAEKSRVLLAMNPTKADLDRMFPKYAKGAWEVVKALNDQIREAFKSNVRDADQHKEIWRIRPEPPGPVTQEWR
ncbi:MAG TPA: ankyrin repeat domain-containing protein, partial [Verrucomicrobiae bacterium]